jgi:hypothetical protein
VSAGSKGPTKSACSGIPLGVKDTEPLLAVEGSTHGGVGPGIGETALVRFVDHKLGWRTIPAKVEKREKKRRGEKQSENTCIG